MECKPMTSPDIIDMKAKVTNDFARAWRLHKAYFEQEHSRAATSDDVRAEMQKAGWEFTEADPPTAAEKIASLPQDLRTVGAMIMLGEKIPFGREVELMRMAAVEIERLRGELVLAEIAARFERNEAEAKGNPS